MSSWNQIPAVPYQAAFRLFAWCLDFRVVKSIRTICLTTRLNVPIEASIGCKCTTYVAVTGEGKNHAWTFSCCTKKDKCSVQALSEGKAPALKMTDGVKPAISTRSKDPKHNFVPELNPPAWGFAWLIRKSGSHIFFSAHLSSPLLFYPLFWQS